MNTAPRLAYVILAAGASRRFGGLKQLAEIRGNTGLLEHRLEQVLRCAADDVHLVLGAHWQKIQQHLQLDTRFPQVRVIVNAQWSSGMASSLRAAIDAIDSHDVDGVMVILGDQIALRAAHLQELRAAWLHQQGAIVAAQYEGILGVPAIFPRSYFAKLQDLRGDQGAKLLIKTHASDVVPFALAHASIDIDTQAQLRQWQVHWQKHTR